MPLPSPKYPNSAGRLLAIFQSLDNKKPLIEQLCLLMDEPVLPRKNNQMSRSDFQMIAHLHDIYWQFRDDMASANISDEQRDVLLNGLAAVETSIYPLVVNANPRMLTDTEKSLLEVCATILPKEGDIEDLELREIQASIEELQQQVKKADTSQELKDILLEMIRLSKDSIKKYNIYGAFGLKKAFKIMLAEVTERYFNASEEEIKTIKSTNAWKSLTVHLKKFDHFARSLLDNNPSLGGESKVRLPV